MHAHDSDVVGVVRGAAGFVACAILLGPLVMLVSLVLGILIWDQNLVDSHM